MRIRSLALSLTAVASFALFVAVTRAPGKDEPAAPKKDPNAEMAEWMKLNEPGPEHKRLAAMAGEWEAVSTMYMPDGKTMESKGKEKCTVVLGGRFVESTYEGNMMGMPFSGRGLTGYDTIKKKYVSTWADSMSTGVLVLEGTSDEANKVMTLYGEQKGADGKVEKLKTVSTIIDDNSYTFDMYSTGADGKEMKMMSIKYTRVKA